MSNDLLNKIDREFLEINGCISKPETEKPSEALEFINNFIAENDYDLLNKNNTGYDIETQARYVQYLRNKSTMLHTIKQALIQAESNLGARRNGKALAQMYQLVNYSRPPMKPAVWVAKIDGNLEQRVVMEKEEYDKLTQPSKKELAFDVIKEKGVNVLDFVKNKGWDRFTYSHYLCYYRTYSLKELTQEEFELLKGYFK